MPLKTKKKNAAKSAISRGIVVTRKADEKIASTYNLIRHALNKSFSTLAQSLATLESEGVALPRFTPIMHSQPLEHPTPRNAIESFEDSLVEQKQLRISIHCDVVNDDTTVEWLDDQGVSHFIAIVASDKATSTWNNGENLAGLLVIAEVQLTQLQRLVHDILIDMAMLHAERASWSWIRTSFSSRDIAALKSKFTHSHELMARFPYGDPNGTRYVPLAGFSRNINEGQFDTRFYSELWQKFEGFCREETDYSRQPEPPLSAQQLAKRIAEHHKFGGQISKKKLNEAVAALSPGIYNLYFLLHHAKTRRQRIRVSEFFQKSPKGNRTQKWIIYRHNERISLAKELVQSSYAVYYTFAVGEPS